MNTAGLVKASSCENKRAYGSWAEAEKVAARMRRHTDEILQPYACSHGCGMFHVGHSDESIRRDERHKFNRRKAKFSPEPTRQPSETHSHNEVRNAE